MLRVSVNLSGRDRERPAVLQPQLLWFYPSAVVSQGSEVLGDVARVLKHEVVDITSIILGPPWGSPWKLVPSKKETATSLQKQVDESKQSVSSESILS